MEVTRYIFQSPYSSQVQIGRPESGTSTNSYKTDTEGSPVANVTSLDAKVEQDSKIAANPSKILDIYA
jgi:hypothetical protein